MSTESKLVKKESCNAVQSCQPSTAGRILRPPVDIYETDRSYVIAAELPGVDKSNVEITLEKDVLTVVGRSQVKQPEGARLGYSEFAPGDYRRSFVVSDAIDRDAIDARMHNGVLRLTLPKSKQALPRKVAVQAA